MTKKWYLSKTLYLNLIGIFWILFADNLSLPTLDQQTEGMILGIINIILRLVTKTEIVFW